MINEILFSIFCSVSALIIFLFSINWLLVQFEKEECDIDYD